MVKSLQTLGLQLKFDLNKSSEGVKRIKTIAFSAAFSAAFMLGMSSFNTKPSADPVFEHTMGNVEFKITNNTGSEFKYCVNGGHNYISSGSTKSFSYSAGQDFYYIEGSNCGKQWFEVTSDMNGKEYKLSDLL